MRYKDYIWPHNPRVYTIEFQRDVAAHKVPFGLYYLQDLGRTCRVMRGEGEFAGAQAYAQFGALANVFYLEGPGPLLHPLWQAASAYFVSLKLEQEPREDYVRYSFEFWEDLPVYDQQVRTVTAAQGESQGQNGGSETARVVHTVCKGETLWGIALRYGMTLQELLERNTQIKNPNLIYPGDQVVVR